MPGIRIQHNRRRERKLKLNNAVVRHRFVAKQFFVSLRALRHKTKTETEFIASLTLYEITLFFTKCIIFSSLHKMFAFVCLN